MNTTPSPLKPWQKGFTIDEIDEYRLTFDNSYNAFARGPFSVWNRPKIADSLSKERLICVYECYHENLGKGKNGALLYCNINEPPVGYIDTHIAKTSTDITMYFDTVIGKKLKGDRIINAIAYTHTTEGKEADIPAFVSQINEWQEPIWLFIFEEDRIQKQIAQEAGFTKIGVKITSFSEIYGIYFREGNNTGLLQSHRVHPQIDPTESVCMLHLHTFPQFTSLAKSMAEKIINMEAEFANHYSKHNKSKAWGAIALRGYSQDPTMIEKPSCMSKAWQKEHTHENFYIQDTPLRQQFPEVEEILQAFPTKNFDRIRLMQLQPGGGELSRHVDHVETDSGVTDGKIMRFHVPIITNPKVIFTMWDTNGERINQNMKQGETWLFDFRKPHMAINGGEDIRIHLVIDVIMDEPTRELIRKHL